MITEYKLGLIDLLDEDGGRIIVAYNTKERCVCTWHLNILQIWEETIEPSYETIWDKVAESTISTGVPLFEEARMFGRMFLNSHFHTDTSK